MKRPRVILILFAILLLGVLVFCLIQPREPSYHGRKLSEWLRDYGGNSRGLVSAIGRSGVRGPTDAAEQAVRAIGTNAIPTFLRWVQTIDSPMKEKWNALLDKQSVIRFRFHKPGEFLNMAYTGFTILGQDALPAIPDLMQLMKSQDITIRIRAVDCMCKITVDKAVLLPSFLQVLQDS